MENIIKNNDCQVAIKLNQAVLNDLKDNAASCQLVESRNLNKKNNQYYLMFYDSNNRLIHKHELVNVKTLNQRSVFHLQTPEYYNDIVNQGSNMKPKKQINYMTSMTLTNLVQKDVDYKAKEDENEEEEDEVSDLKITNFNNYDDNIQDSENDSYLNLLEYADNELNLLEDNLVSIMRGFSQAGNHQWTKKQLKKKLKELFNRKASDKLLQQALQNYVKEGSGKKVYSLPSYLLKEQQ